MYQEEQSKPETYNPSVTEREKVCSCGEILKTKKNKSGLCRKCSARKASLGFIKGRKRKAFTVEHREKLRLAKLGKKRNLHTLETREKMAEKAQKRVLEGRCNFWKGGKTKLGKKLRSSFEYKRWRELVFQGDGYKCRLCGQIGGDLNADHHPETFANLLEKRKDWKYASILSDPCFWEISNGRTLCVQCHKMTPTYGRPKG